LSNFLLTLPWRRVGERQRRETGWGEAERAFGAFTPSAALRAATSPLQGR